MATPTGSSKRYYNCAVKQGSAWGTAAAVAAGDALVVTSDGNPALKQPYERADNIGVVVPVDGDLGALDAVEFSPEFGGKCGLQYEMGGMGYLIAGFFGNLTAPAKLTDAAYKHVFELADEMTDFFTFATERPGSIWEIPSCVPNKLTLKLGNGKLQGSIGLVGNTLVTDSTTNTATQLDAVTPAATANFVKSQSGVLRMNAQTGDALDSGDSVIVSEFEVTYERTIDKQQVLGGTYIGQPHESELKVSVKIKLPYADGTNVPAYMAIFKAMTAQKMDVTFTGGVASSPDHYSLVLGFPRLKLVTPPDVKLEDFIRNGLEFEAEEAASAPTGMTGYFRPYMEVVNLRSTAYVS